VYRSKGVVCEFELDPPRTSTANSGDLQEMLGNLLENAFKWSQARVLLTVQSESGKGMSRPGLSIAVEDDGPGVDLDNVETLLQRGARGDERVQGHGIGWRSCRTSCAPIAAS
jgi:two-component system sensor histidine kinase PhoQ